MPTLAEVQASNAKIRALLNSAATQIAENGKMMRFDLTVAQRQLAQGEALEARMLGQAPQIRRLLSIQHTKGL